MSIYELFLIRKTTAFKKITIMAKTDEEAIKVANEIYNSDKIIHKEKLVSKVSREIQIFHISKKYNSKHIEWLNFRKLKSSGLKKIRCYNIIKK